MGAHGGPKLEGLEDLTVYTDAANNKRGIEAGVGLSANQRDVTPVNQAARGIIGGTKALIFDGSNDSVDFSPSVSVAHNDPWTFSCWFYIGNSSSQHRRHLLCVRSSGTNVGSITYYYNSTTDANGDQVTRVRFLIRELRDNTPTWGNLSLYPGIYGSQYVLTPLQDAYWCNQWHHFVLRKGYGSDSRYDCFIDGEYRASYTRSTSYVNNGLEANSFGGNSQYSGWYGGIGGPKIYTKALSDKAIARLYKRFANRYGK